MFRLFGKPRGQTAEVAATNKSQVRGSIDLLRDYVADTADAVASQNAVTTQMSQSTQQAAAIASALQAMVRSPSNSR